MASKADEQNLNPPVSEEADYEQLIDDYTHFAPPHEGELLQGRVVKLHDKDVIVDFGYKSEGLVPIEQFTLPDGSVQVQVGDLIDVMVDRQGVQPEGYILLSHQKASRLRSWENLEKAHRDGLVVSGRVTGRIKGGLSVDVGVPAFMPGSQIDVRPTHNLDSFLGQDIPVKIVKLNRRRGNVVVSRKMAVEEELLVRKSAALQVLEEGGVVVGIVKNLTEYGAFIDLGGIDGLLHVSDMSYGRVNHPSEMVHAGDSITVKVLKFDKSKERISLGMKQLVPDPWETIEQRYPMGGRVIGRVVSVTDYGAFVELEPGVEGLIHISEMTWSRRMKHPGKVVKAGDQVEAVVLDVKPKERRVSLGIKQLEVDPWTTVSERYSIGSVVEGRIRKLADFGAFVEIEEGIDGLVHISDLSWTKKVKHPSELYRKGDEVDAVVLGIDIENERVSLGIKQLSDDPWNTIAQRYPINTKVNGKVTSIADFGVFVEIEDGIEGLIHVSQLSSERVDKPSSLFKVGDQVEALVVQLDPKERRIGLSIRVVKKHEEREEMQAYMRRE